MNTPVLPINEVLVEIKNSLRLHNKLVLQAPPGAGKTTMVPLAMVNEPWLKGQKILMLEPRRMAARTSAERMADLLGEKVGETVGYRIRQENRISAQTRIEVITEGILTRQLQSDPELNGIGLIIFDEFHERNLNADLGLALSLQAGELFREVDNPLKILLMSATLDSKAISTMLGNAPQICSEGKMFPVEIHYGKTLKTHDSIVLPMVETIKQAMYQSDGSILVFLPGQSEIIQLKKALEPIVERNVCVLPLYGALSLAAQMQAIKPLANNDACKRKIVLATDIAETSLTIEGINMVIDSGLSRQPEFAPGTGLTRLHTRRISQASSIQRMGRAGRTQPGKCYRLWSKETQASLEKQIPAEILQADLCPLVLQLLQWGVSDPDELKWLDKPPKAAFDQALDLLYSLGALKQNPRQSCNISLTDHGLQMARFPTHPRLAHMLIKAVSLHQIKTAAAIATLISDKDPLRQYGSDITAKVSVLLGDIPCELQFRAWFKRSQQQMKLFENLCRSIPVDNHITIAENDIIGLLISLAYPDRIAQRRQGERADKSRRYLLSNGRAASLPEDDKLVKSEYLVIAEMGGLTGLREDRIYSAAPLNPDLFSTILAPLVSQQQSIEWHDQTARLIAQQQQKIGNLVISRKTINKIPVELKGEILMQLVSKKGLDFLPWTESVRQWQARIECLRNHDINANNKAIHWPDVSDENLLNTLKTWLQPYVNNVNKIEDFQKLDLQACLSSLLTWPLPKQLNELAPLTFTVPSGSAIKIDYSQSPPVLAVKLQEMFGCLQTPTIANGKVSLLVHLLSPARKPLQITQDLAGFWSGSYQAVKKEMKGRYPKHPWPDDPLQAQASRYTKHRNYK